MSAVVFAREKLGFHPDAHQEKVLDETIRRGILNCTRQGGKSTVMAIKALQLCFAVYQASNERRAIDPATIDGAVTPTGWPPTPDKLKADVEAMMEREEARASRVAPPTQ